MGRGVERILDEHLRQTAGTEGLQVQLQEEVSIVTLCELGLLSVVTGISTLILPFILIRSLRR